MAARPNARFPVRHFVDLSREQDAALDALCAARSAAAGVTIARSTMIRVLIAEELNRARHKKKSEEAAYLHERELEAHAAHS